MGFGTSPDMAAQVVEAVRKVYHKTLIVKLSPNVTSIVEIAKAVEGAGADSVSLINTLLGMAIDIDHRRPYDFCRIGHSAVFQQPLARERQET